MTDEIKLLTAPEKITIDTIHQYLMGYRDRMGIPNYQDGIFKIISDGIRYMEGDDPWDDNGQLNNIDGNRIDDRLHRMEMALCGILRRTAPVAKEKAPRAEQLAKERCQAVAKLLWQMNPEMTIAEVATHEAVYNLGITEGKRYKPETVRDWVAKVDPRPAEKKIGRPRKTKKVA